MAANKFATMLHKNTNKITIILIYAVLEWTLIILLFLNSLFSHLIIKFSQYFGLKPPCLLCSRVDHIFEPGKNKKRHLDLFCEAHIKEISQLGNCSTHQKVVESQDMCEDGLSSKLPEFREVLENCSCRSVTLDKEIYTKNSNYHIKEDPGSDYEFEHCFEKQDVNAMISDVIEKVDVVIKEENEEKEDIFMKDEAKQVSIGEDSQHLEFFIDFSGHKLVRVELIDSAAEDDQNREIAKNDDQGMSDQSGPFTDFEIHEESKIEVAIRENAEHFEHMKERSRYSEFESMEIEVMKASEDKIPESDQGKEEQRCSEFKAMEIKEDEDSLVKYVQVMEASEKEETLNTEFHQGCGDINSMQVKEAESDVSIGTEIPDLDTTDNIQNQADNIQLQDPPLISVHNADDIHGSIQVEEPLIELCTLSVEVDEHVMNNRAPFYSDLNEIEEEKVPETPTSTDNFDLLHKKLLQLEKKEDSLDGSEFENNDGVITIEQLKSTLRAERKALYALYSELEEERNASTVSANQTMAMINRLQEEKSAMQIEALQYQRMMDEQAEYDQEALQLLNELMVKREKEKEELEKELDVYRKKLLEYESKEKMRLLRRSKEFELSSRSCSNAEDSDVASLDLNQVPLVKDEDGFSTHENENMVLNLEESVADFEDERLLILEQLKVLEEKLMTLDDEDLQRFEDVRSIDDIENGHSKGLLPLFDAESDENVEIMQEGNDLSIPNKKFAIEEELDSLYERVQALEEDREFLKHCVGSLNKGEKGMHILNEILQHLRNLRNVDLRVKNLSDGATV